MPSRWVGTRIRPHPWLVQRGRVRGVLVCRGRYTLASVAAAPCIACMQNRNIRQKVGKKWLAFVRASGMITGTALRRMRQR
jgi:hypothetical protein